MILFDCYHSSGLGLTILPRGYAPLADRDLVAVPLTHPTPTREVLLVQRGAGQLATPRVVATFSEALVHGAGAPVPRRQH